MRSSSLRRSAVLFAFAAGCALAQQFPFQLRVVTTNNAAVVPNGQTLVFSAAVGQSQSARLTATYTGSGKITVSQTPNLFGSPAFTASMDGSPPLSLSSGDSINIDIVFRPTSATQANSQLNLPFTETLFTTNPPTITQSAINLNLQGTAPSFVLSYVLQTDLNTVPLQPGGTIAFPDTLINTTVQASLTITNVGSGPGQVNNVTLTGSTALKFVGLPLFPVNLNAGAPLQLVVRYQPLVVGADSAQVQITYDSGPATTITVQGNGVAPAFSYDLLQPGETIPVTPPGPITLPDTNVGDKNSVVIRVKNAGSANGTINAAPSVNGTGFQLSNLPVFPQVLKPNDSFALTLTFSATQPGDQTGQLLIGTDLFTVNGRGLGPKLAFSYVSGGTTTTLGPADSVIFSPTAIGASSRLDFVVANTGTTAAKVSNIGIGEAKSPFAITQPLTLPTSLDPGATIQFPIQFTPATTGFLNGTLRVDATIVPLLGSGTEPPPLPAYTIQGPTGNVDPQSQPAIRLKLASPYPLALAGVLTLTTSSDLVNDPAVQFATGGRTVAFTIPANGTDANFAGQGPQIRLQTGTVASTITLTPSFATQSGGVDVTPASPATLQLTVAPAAPVLIAVQALNQTTNGFSLTLTGFSTTRTLTSANVQFTAASGVRLNNTQVSIDVRGAATVWFQSAASQPFGGQFTVTIPFTLQGVPPSGGTLLSTISAVSATIANERGTSSSQQTTIP
jgi:hypothetical protein